MDDTSSQSSTSAEYAAEQSRVRRIYPRVQETQRYHVYLLQLAFLVLAIALTLFLDYLVALPLDPQTQRAATDPLSRFMQAVSAPGFAPWNFILAAIGCVLVAVWLGWVAGGYLALVTVLQGLVTTALKITVPTERPEPVDVNAPIDAINNAFPSGHVMFFVVFFGFVLYLAWTHLSHRLIRWTILLGSAIFIVLGGVSRLYMGSHWLADVVGAQVVGFAIVVLAIEVYERSVVPWWKRKNAE